MADTGSHKLAHILWQCAKQLVSLLEKEFGFGRQADPARR